MGEILDGKLAAREVREKVRVDVERLVKETGVTPGLAAVLVGDDPASNLYVDMKRKACTELGLRSFYHHLPATTTEDDLLALVAELNENRDVHGILVQLPLPKGLSEKRVLFHLSPEKDIDGLHPVNQGRLLAGQSGLRPCTPLGVMYLIDKAGARLEGKRAVVVGRSLLVGKPVALMLLERHATVTMCHSRTTDLAGEVGSADVLVAAVGKAEMVKGAWVKPGSVVVDVGINRTAAGLRGDVEFAAAKERAAFITPVPGGVGPMTVAMLVRNTVVACKRTLGLADGLDAS